MPREFHSDLTEYQQSVLDYLHGYSGIGRSGDDPWERSFVQPRTSAESRAMAVLHERGLVECQFGRAASKIPNRYRISAVIPEGMGP